MITMKFVIPVVILIIVFSDVLCDDLDSRVDSIKNTNTTVTTKTKRGVLGYPGYSYSHGFHYGIPPSYSTGYHGSPYSARFPTILKNVYHPTTGYALSHGGASVTSYNINYPRYSFHSTKPHIHIPVQSPLPKPVVPTPSVVFAQKPIVPIAVPTFPTSKPFVPIGVPSFSNRIPFILSKPIPDPFPPGLATPSLIPFGIQSQFIPIPFQPTINSFPSTISSPESIPLPGSTFINNIQPVDQWRPILVNQQPTPTAATTPHFHRPAINLLPPYGQTDLSHQSQLELQQDNYDGYPDEQQYAGRVSELYLSPNPASERNQPLFQQQQQQLIKQDVSQIAFDHQEQGRNIASFKYDPPSNNGQYSGPSSYEVALGSYTGAF